MTPTVTPIVQGLQVTWFDFEVTADVDHYEVFYGTSSPPTTKWGDVNGKFATVLGLTPGVTYFIQIRAVDCFGPGSASAIVTGVPLPFTEDASGSDVTAAAITLTTDFQDLASLTLSLAAGDTVYLWASANFSLGPANGTLRITREGAEIWPGGVVIPSGSVPATGVMTLIDAPGVDSSITYVFQAKTNSGTPEASHRRLDALIKS